MAAGYLAINIVFALAYLADPGGVTNARPGDFADHFFFSVQTLGVGRLRGDGPPELSTPMWSWSLESLRRPVQSGHRHRTAVRALLAPDGRIMFSDIAVVAPFDGAPALMLRAANRRRNLVVEAEVTISLVRDVTTVEGVTMRRFYDLSVVRSRTPLFFLTWQVIHTIDEASPLWGETAASLVAQRSEIVVIMKGLDETYVSTIHARASYTPDQIVWGRQLEDIFITEADGERFIDFRKFHEAE